MAGPRAHTPGPPRSPRGRTPGFGGSARSSRDTEGRPPCTVPGPRTPPRLARRGQASRTRGPTPASRRPAGQCRGRRLPGRGRAGPVLALHPSPPRRELVGGAQAGRDPGSGGSRCPGCPCPLTWPEELGPAGRQAGDRGQAEGRGPAPPLDPTGARRTRTWLSPRPPDLPFLRGDGGRPARHAVAVCPRRCGLRACSAPGPCVLRGPAWGMRPRVRGSRRLPPRGPGSDGAGPRPGLGRDPRGRPPAPPTLRIQRLVPRCDPGSRRLLETVIPAPGGPSEDQLRALCR